MSLPHLTASRLLLFCCGARVLYRSSQALLAAGSLEADLPLAIQEARQVAEAKLTQAGIPLTDPLVMDALGLMPPPEVLGLLRDWIDRGAGPDLEGFLATVDPAAEGILRLPKQVVCPEALRQVLERIPFEADEEVALRANLDRMETQLARLASQTQIDPEPLRAQTQAGLAQLSPEELLVLVQDYSLEEALQEDPPPQPDHNTLKVVGPLLLIEMADHLLGIPDLTPDQRLDLQTNRGKAEAKLRAMQKLGRVEDPEAQKQQIQAWIQQFSRDQLLQTLDRLFEREEPEE